MPSTAAVFQTVIVSLLLVEITNFTKELQYFASKMVDSLRKDADSVSFLLTTTLKENLAAQ